MRNEDSNKSLVVASVYGKSMADGDANHGSLEHVPNPKNEHSSPVINYVNQGHVWAGMAAASQCGLLHNTSYDSDDSICETPVQM